MSYHVITAVSVNKKSELMLMRLATASLRATAVPAGTAEARISYGNSVRLSVCLSVCHDPVAYQAQMR